MIDNELCINLLKETIENNGHIQLTVHGESMLPTIKDGDSVLIEKSDAYSIGDIVAFPLRTLSGLKFIIHRVVFVRKNYILTKGDNNNFIDKVKVNTNSIIGKVLMH